MGNEIYVTRPLLPHLEDYIKYLEIIWNNQIITNNGPMVQQLEYQLKQVLNVHNIVTTVNATLALQIAIKALRLKGEIITTPFTFIATASAIQWENCTPVFVDVDPETFNISLKAIEKKITDKTSAILGVHVFSNPCDVESIEVIADKNKLKVLYDGAHCMMVNYKGKSLLEYGDISVVSFHANKLFNTVEGGACITKNKNLNDRLKHLREFGYNDDREVVDFGTNAKMSELHAALGLCTLKYIEAIIANRKIKHDLYVDLLSYKSRISFQKINKDSYNYTYMPVLFESQKELLKALIALNKENIFPKRYFYPTINKIKALVDYKITLPVAEAISERILCLPMYDSLSLQDIERICKIINDI